MKNAIALVTESVLKSALKDWMGTRLDAAGIEVRWHSVTRGGGQFVELFNAHRNVIAWNCRMPHAWLHRNGQNVLHIENSLISQRAGIFVDHGGFFTKSNLHRQETWKQPHRANVEFFTRREFGWEAFSGGTPGGPVLVCLQNGPDCNLQWEFPLSERGEDKVKKTLQLVRDHLPKDRPVWIRPHPRHVESFAEKQAEYLGEVWREDFQPAPAGPFKKLLPQCSALVAVNSTCVNEAVTLGLPVATLGTGAFTGTGCTLECGQQPERLAELGVFHPEREACRAYAAAILARHFLPYDVQPQRENEEFNLWLNSAQ